MGVQVSRRGAPKTPSRPVGDIAPCCGSCRRREDRSLCKQLGQVGEGFEFQSVPGGIQEEHGCLLTNLTLETDVGFDLELDIGRDQTIAKLLPVIQFQDNSEMGNRDIVAIDGIVMRRSRLAAGAMCHDLVPIQIKIDPSAAAATLGQPEHTSIEATCFGKVTYGKCKMEGAKGHVQNREAHLVSGQHWNHVTR